MPVIGIGIAFVIRRPTYFELVGLMLGLLLSIPYILLMNFLAEYMGWWSYPSSENSYTNIPLEIIIGWSIFWGVFLPYVFSSLNIIFPIAVALMIDIFCMPLLEPIFSLGENWLVGEAVLIISCLFPSLLIYQLTANRQQVLARALIQSYIWGGWIVFLIPSIVLYINDKNIFNFFHMSLLHTSISLLGLGFSMVPGYLALIEFASKGRGTPIPFDPPQKLVTTGIYSYVANPLQVSTMMIFISIMFAYKSWMMLFPIFVVFVYSELFVRWHHTVDIEKRFGDEWFEYRKNVKNWVPRFSKY